MATKGADISSVGVKLPDGAVLSLFIRNLEFLLQLLDSVFAH